MNAALDSSRFRRSSSTSTYWGGKAISAGFNDCAFATKLLGPIVWARALSTALPSVASVALIVSLFLSISSVQSSFNKRKSVGLSPTKVLDALLYHRGFVREDE